MKSYRLDMHELSRVGAARRAAESMASEAGLTPDNIARAALIGTEMATNLIKHATGAELHFRILSEDQVPGIELLAIDRGPGIADIAASLSDGYSTAGSSGTGLGAIRRMASQFDVFSTHELGTVLLARVRESSESNGRRRNALDLGVISVPVAGETVCGDQWKTVRRGSATMLVVADGLGHGPLAYEAACAVLDAFDDSSLECPGEVIRRAHTSSVHTRGAAAAVALLDPRNASVTYAGLGNISCSVVDRSTEHHLVSHMGIVGHQAAQIQEFTYPWGKEAMLVMHSDGLNTKWDLRTYPGLSSRHPSVIAGVLYRDFRRERDDVTVVVAQQQTGQRTR